MPPANGVISLLTDFGTTDAYVGTMKAVILARAPAARLVDLCHEVPPQDVSRAAFLLYTAAPYFPPGTVHLAVVDPGVGTSRRPVALATERAFFVGPDNGLFTYATTRDPVIAVVELRRADHRLADVSYTFHGRDIFAPAAAHLAAGGRLSDLGPPLSDLVRLPPFPLEITGSTIRGEVLHTDRFGNAITSIGPLTWEGDTLILSLYLSAQVGRGAGGKASPLRLTATRVQVRVADQTLRGIHHTYAEAAPGMLLALVGSHGHLEIATNGGNAAQALNLQPGNPIMLAY